MLAPLGKAGGIGFAGLMIASIFALGATVSPPGVSIDLCGMSITSDLRLDHDLTCANDGLIVAADGITIRLHGHSITGSGTDANSAGIRIVGRSGVSVQGPGTITLFRTGVLVGTSNHIVVSKVHAVDNGLMTPGGPPFPFSRSDGIHVTMSSNVVVEKNLVRHNGDDGINVHMSTGVWVVKNAVVNNTHDGIRLDAANGNVLAKNRVLSHDSVFRIGTPPVPTPVGCGIELFGSKDNVIEENRLVGNTNGIRLRTDGTNPSTGNVVEDNKVSGDGAELGGRRGIHVRDTATGNVIEGNSVTNLSVGISLGDPGTPVGNTFEENHIRRNVCGVKGSMTGNVFEENKFKDNGTDFCPP